MPTYDYECAACGHAFEEFQKISDPVLKTCPECRKRKLVRLIGTGGAVLFKGGGFYETDNRSSEYKEKAKADSDAASGKSESKSESSADTASSSKND
jgi:putative FmdB family regulatory protein